MGPSLKWLVERDGVYREASQGGRQVSVIVVISISNECQS